MRRGLALYRLCDSLEGTSASELRGRIPARDVERGEILYQGKFGFCIASERTHRRSVGSLPVLCLHDASAPKRIAKEYLVPVKELLAHVEGDSRTSFSSTDRQVIEDLVIELSSGLRAVLDS